MKTKDLENLLRMVVEIDGLDRAARAAPPRIEPPTLRPVRLVRRRPWLLLRFGLVASAAAVLLLTLAMPHQTQPEPVAGPQCPLAIDFWSGVPREDGVRMACFEPSTSERCSVLAIFRRWQHDCQCLVWQLYEWEDGRPLAELSPEEISNIALDVTDAPPVEQLLVVAIARNPGDLPTSADQAGILLNCLDDVEPPAGAHAGVSAYATAVQQCLPEGVTVVPRPFLIE